MVGARSEMTTPEVTSQGFRLAFHSPSLPSLHLSSWWWQQTSSLSSMRFRRSEMNEISERVGKGLGVEVLATYVFLKPFASKYVGKESSGIIYPWSLFVGLW